MKFITNGMLGKLSRWLRMLGHNVKYSPTLNDEQLIKIAKKEHRTLLTRDLELYRQAITKGTEAFLVEGTTEAEKLANLAKRFDLNLEIDVTVSRCPKCNTRIKPIPKDRVIDKVPLGTSSKYEEFWECPSCGQVYWRGSHWRGIETTLREARRTVKPK